MDDAPKLYPDLNPWDLEPYFCRHMAAMTAEDLHSKADIARQLAWRDQCIATLRARLALAERVCTAAEDAAHGYWHEALEDALDQWRKGRG